MQSANTRNQYIDDHEEKGGVKLDSGRIKSAPSDGRRFTPEAVIIVSVINRHHRRLSKSSSRRHHDPTTIQEYRISRYEQGISRRKLDPLLGKSAAG